MKVLNKKKREQNEYRVTCGECLAKLEYVKSDIDKPKSVHGIKHIICPECGNVIKHKKKNKYKY